MNTIDKLIMEGDKICVYSIRLRKELTYDTMTEMHKHHAKNVRMSEIFDAMKKMKRIAGILIYPESMRENVKKHISDIEKAKAARKQQNANAEKPKCDNKPKTKTKKPGTESHKGCAGCPIVVYNLETGERKEYNSIQNASRRIPITFSVIHDNMDKHKPFEEYFAMRKDEEAEFVKLLPYYKAKYKREIKKCKKKVTLDQRNFVWLRVDAKTEILVPKEKATKEYAEWFNLKRLNPKLPSFDMWNKSKNKEKRK